MSDGVRITNRGAVLQLAVPGPMPVLLEFTGDHLEALTNACLQAFRDGGGKLFQRRFVSDLDRQLRQKRELEKLTDGWRNSAANNNDSEFARGVVAGLLGCALQLEKMVKL